MEKKNEATVIRISKELKKALEYKKLVPNETYDHLLKRILKIGDYSSSSHMGKGGGL